MASPRGGYERDDHVGDGAMVNRDGRSSPRRRRRRRPFHRRHERPSRWKERLRRKFDVALGLESPPSSSSSSMAGTYYDSWMAQMKDVDDGRKEALRLDERTGRSLHGRHNVAKWKNTSRFAVVTDPQ
jgi:hypothetical protein